MRITVCCNQGGRRYMEDNVSVNIHKKENGDIDFIFIGVFDGHGGAQASLFAKQHLLKNVLAQSEFYSENDEEVLGAIKNGFRETHQQMWKEVDTWPRTLSGFTSTSGTTSSVAFIKNGKIYTGHVGDSGIVLGERVKGADDENCKVSYRQLTVDHKPDNPDELKRIVEAGGEVQSKSGVFRVVWMRPRRGHQGPLRRSTPLEKIPFLAVARSLGDLWSYNSEIDTFVVSPEPDVSCVPINSNHNCLVFGTDGLWNVVHPQSAVDLLELNDVGGTDEAKLNWNHARLLVRHALFRWGNLRADNVSAVVVAFDSLSLTSSTANQKSIISVVNDARCDCNSVFEVDKDAMLLVEKDVATFIRTSTVELVYMGQMDSPDPDLNENNRRNIFSLVRPAISMNKISTAADSDNFSGSATQQINSSGDIVRKKPKYWCKKHGIACEKARQMNEAYERDQARLALAASHTIETSSFVVEAMESTSDVEENLMTPVSALGRKRSVEQRASAGGKVNVNNSYMYATRAASMRVTRSGARFDGQSIRKSFRRSLPNGIMGRCSTSSVFSKRLKMSRAIARRVPPNETSATPELHQDAKLKQRTRSLRSVSYSRVIQLRAELAKSVHKFRLQKLKHCLRQHISGRPKAPSASLPKGASDQPADRKSSIGGRVTRSHFSIACSTDDISQPVPSTKCSNGVGVAAATESLVESLNLEEKRLSAEENLCSKMKCSLLSCAYSPQKTLDANKVKINRMVHSSTSFLLFGGSGVNGQDLEGSKSNDREVIGADASSKSPSFNIFSGNHQFNGSVQKRKHSFDDDLLFMKNKIGKKHMLDSAAFL